MLPIKQVAQLYSYDCGGAVFASIIQSYGLETIENTKQYRQLLKKIHCGIDGLSVSDLCSALNSYGLKNSQQKYKKYDKLSNLVNEQLYPVIVSWHSIFTHAPHYSIVVDANVTSVTLMDPNFSERLHLDDKTFYDNWFFMMKNTTKVMFERYPDKCVEVRPMIVVEKPLK
jgi:predicted double-glycine peptidase